MQLQWEAEKPFLVAARSELFTVLINLSGVPASAEERFLRMQALRYSPYKEFAIHVARLDKTHCLMWGWDANWEREHRQGLPRELQKAPLIPETVLHPCGDSGAYLRACGAGYELQVWKETRLEISRWYPERPEGGALDTALRAEGVEALSGADEAVQWLPRPWPEEEDISLRFRRPPPALKSRAPTIARRPGSRESRTFAGRCSPRATAGIHP